MLLYPAPSDPCMKNSADDVDMTAAFLQQQAADSSPQDAVPPLPALQLQQLANRHRLEAIMNTGEAAAAAAALVGRATAVAVASKSSLAFILGQADEDQAPSFGTWTTRPAFCSAAHGLTVFGALQRTSR
jgi:hypothetical protein